MKGIQGIGDTGDKRSTEKSLGLGFRQQINESQDCSVIPLSATFLAMTPNMNGVSF